MSTRLSWTACAVGVAVLIGWFSSLVTNFLQDNIIPTIVIITACLNISLVYWMVKKLKTKSLYTNLPAVFILCFTVYMITYPLDFASGILSNMPESSVIASLKLYFVADIALVVSAGVFVFFSGLNAKTSNREVAKLVASRRVSILFIVLGLVLLGYTQMKMGGLSTFGVANKLKAFSLAREQAGTYLSVPWQAVLVVGLFSFALTVKNKKDKLEFFALLFVLALLFFFGLGDRELILTCCYPAIAVLIDRGVAKASRKWSLFVAVIVMLTLSPIITNFRNSIMTGQPMSSFPASTWAYSTGETGAAFQITAKIATSSDWTGTSSSYLDAVAHDLPSKLYTFLFGHPKPPTLDVWYIEHYFYYAFRAGGGLGFSPVAEAFMNGGYFAVVVMFAFLGWVITRAHVHSVLKYFLLSEAMSFQREPLSVVLGTLIFVIALYYISRFIGRLVRVPSQSSIAEERAQIMKSARFSDYRTRN